MANYDGSHLGSHKSKSRSLIQTAANMVEHCILVSSRNKRNSIRRLEGRVLNIAPHRQIDTPFKVIGGGFIESSNASSQIRAYVAENEHAIVISFRGSKVQGNFLKSVDNALVDVNLRLIRDTNFPGKVHRGFVNDYKVIQSEILSRLDSTDFINTGKPVYVTGFSLGAGLASLCALDLKIRYKSKINIHTYLFAQPAAGDHDFARAFSRKLTHVFRFAHVKDVVSQIPHSLVCQYKAPGNKLLVFNNAGDQVHHNKIKLLLKANRIGALSSISRTLRRTLLSTTIAKMVVSFASVHSPDHYKKKLVRLHRNYADNIDSNSSLLQAAEKQYQECQQHCLDI